MRPEDLAQLRVPGVPALHGDLLLVAVSSPDLDTNRYAGGLHRVPTDGGPPRAWTAGAHDSSPVISPDGALVAFLRASAGGRPQLHLLPTDGGEARQLTDLPLGAGTPVWSPDSRRIAFTARVPEPGRYGTPVGEDEEAPGADAEAPRRITSLRYRLDNIGFTTDRRPRLFVLDVSDMSEAPADVEARQLTDGGFAVRDPAWTPDGTHLVVAISEDLETRDTLRDALYAVPADGGQAVRVTEPIGQVHLPMVTADGVLLYLGTEFEGIDAVGRNTGVFAAPLDLTGPPELVVPARPHRLTDEETVDCEPSAGRPVPHEGGLLVGVRHRGAVQLRRVPLDVPGVTLDELPLLAAEHGAVLGFCAQGGRIAVSVSTVDGPGEVLLDGVVRTDLAAPLRSRGVRPAVELTGTAADGYPVHGLLVLPEGPGPHPVLLNVHGGPFMYHGWGFLDEAQTYAAAGYAVVLPNPRGSAGYGQAHGRAVIGAIGVVDVADLLATLDVALARPDLDAGRVGLMGGSYGGLMTAWLAAHHGDRFVAAWAERAVTSWDSFVGSSDIGWWFADAYCGSAPDALRTMSPLTYAEQICIPFAVVHSEHDWRCPVEQAQRLFVALRRNGVAAEFLLFPGEGHELSRSGKPRHRHQRLHAVLEWWGRHLPV